jgi:acetolactate synthase-1/3 small subunit/acetolactate synthase II small subunit
MVMERLTIDFTPAEGALVRMLGLVERRGYVIRGLAVNEQADGASLVIDVEPRDPGRRVRVMAQQLDRLIDVNSVCFETSGAGSRT